MRTGSSNAGVQAPGVRASSSDAGFSLIEVITSLAVMLVVMTAAWLLLITSNSNLNRVGNGGEASEGNRAALASFERDLGHAVLSGTTGGSAVLVAQPRTCSFLADNDSPADGRPEVITWAADDANHRLLRAVTIAPASTPTTQLVSLAGFAGGSCTTATVLDGLADGSDLVSNAGGRQTAMFAYALSATEDGGDLSERPNLVGLINFRLRNGRPSKDLNVSDRTGAFRVIAYVINGY